MFSDLINSILDKKNMYSTDLDKINQYIRNVLYNTKIQNDICQIILGSGKRVRSLLALSIYHQYYEAIPKNIYKILALTELIHFGSLLHDDIVDKNNTRRGKQSVYGLYGAKKTIILGDYLLIKIFDEIVKLHTEQYVVDNFVKVASSTAYGAYLEQNLNPTCSLEEYIKMVSLKTSSLFKFASTIGLQNLKKISEIGIWAICFGIIYQVQNDLDDYDTEMFENSEDYMQNNITYPVVVLYNKHSKLFTNKNKENFLHIKNIIRSEEFRQITLCNLSKYLKRLTDTKIYIK